MQTLQLETLQEEANKKAFAQNCRRAFILGSFVAFGIAMTGCAPASNSGGSGGSASGSNGVAVRLSDAPGNIDWIAQANITISGAYALVDSGGVEKWTDVSTSTQTLNLLDLRGGLSLLLGNVDVQNASISQLRLIIDSASVTLKDGRVFPLKIPSGAESGLKIFIAPALEIVNGQASELMLDFDVANSFVATGNPASMSDVKGFIFKPVIRVGNSAIHGSNSGEIYGDNCTPDDDSDDQPIENATVEVRDANDNVVTANSSVGNGKFAIYGLGEGKYKIHVSANGHQAKDLDDVEERHGEDSDDGRIVLAQTNCPVTSSTGTSTSTGTSSGSASGSTTDTSVTTASSTGTSSVSATTSTTGTSTSSVSTSSTNTTTAVSTASATDTTVSTATATATNTAVSTSATSTTTVSSTATATSSSSVTSNSTGWGIAGFDATTAATSMGVIWQTQVPTTAVLHIGTDPNNLTLFTVNVTTPNTSQIVSVSGLTPSTTYYLQVTATDANGLSQDSVIIMKTTLAQ